MRLGKILKLLLLLALIGFIADPSAFTFVFAPLAPEGAPAIYTQSSLLSLSLSHLRTVFGATAVAAVIAILLGVFVTRPVGRDFLPLSRTLSNLGQTMPPVAVLAIAVPLVGFGEAPTFIALSLYGLLPIFENTLSGLLNVPPLTLDAAKGMGMTSRRRLLDVELPLALPIILAGVRLSLVVNLSTATIGSTVAAKGLGEVIIAGLQANNTAYVVQGGLIVALMAFFIHDVFRSLEKKSSRLTTA